MQSLKKEKGIARETTDKMQSSKKKKGIARELKEEKMNTVLKSKSEIR